MKILLNAEQLDAGVECVSKQLNKKFKETVGEKEICLIGVLNGAFVFMADLTRKLDFEHTIDFIKVSSYTGQQQGDLILNTNNFDFSKYEDKIVIIVDELLDTGETLDKVCKKFKETTADVYSCVLLQKFKFKIIEETLLSPRMDESPKKETKKQSFVPDFVGYKNIPDVWVIGYGLDANGYKRNLKDLYAIEKADGINRSYDDRIFESETYYEFLLTILKL